MKKSKEEIVGWVFIILHLVGIAGFSIEATRALFQWLTPFNLLISLSLLLWMHSNINPRFVLLSVLIAILGYLVEVIGVNTGQVFGDYEYGETLGIKLWQTPLIIGVNWLMMIYYSSAIAQRVTSVKSFQIIFGALIMVGMDLLIEPVAIAYDYWSWYGESIPIQNYLGWFLLSIILHGIYSSVESAYQNKAAIYLAIAQLIFFAVLNIIITF